MAYDKARRPPPQQTMRELFVAWSKEEKEKRDNTPVSDDLATRIFGLEMMALHCGWMKLSDEMEVWRENRYKEIAEARVIALAKVKQSENA